MAAVYEPKQAPATRTFAASREDVLSTLAFFFGDAVSPEKLKNYSEQHAATYHFPDAFAGSNLRIRDTLNNLILHTPTDWQTSVALPFVQIEGTVVQWDEIHFDQRLMQRVPYEGVSRMQTSIKRSHRDRVVRRGIAMMIESDFYTTEAGRKHFSDQLTSIKYCVQETVNFDALHAYLSCGNYDFRYDMSKGLRPKRSVRTAMQKEIASYAIAQLEEFGFDKAIEEAKASMARYSVTPNMLVIAPQTSLYMNVGGMERIKYDSYGQKGPSQFDAGVAGFEAQQFRGCGVFTSPPFDNGDESDAVQMLERSTQIGEFYRVKAPETKTTGLPATYLDLTIYDEEKDKLVHIPFATLLKAAIPKDMDIDDVPWGGTGTGVPAKPDAAAAGKTLAETWVDLILKKMETADRYMEIEIVVARPFIEHQMLSAVLTVAGRDTGATLYGPADMQVSANTSVKTIEGHFTCHTKAVITKPQNVYVIRDVMCNGYVAGCNTKFFGMDKDTPHPTTAQIKKAMEDRLAFDEPEEANWGSMLAFAVEYGDGETRDQVISISSRVLPWELGRNGGKEYFPGGKKGWETYQEAYGLDSIHYGEDPKAAEAQDFLSAGSVNNALCFVGPHRVFSPWGMAGQEELVPGQGHFGSDARPGDARWRRGESVSATSVRNSLAAVALK